MQAEMETAFRDITGALVKSACWTDLEPHEEKAVDAYVQFKKWI